MEYVFSLVSDNGTVLVDPFSVGLQTSVSVSLPAVSSGQTIVLHLSALNGAGLSTVSTLPILVDADVPVTFFAAVLDLSSPLGTADVDWQSDQTAVYASLVWLHGAGFRHRLL